MLIPTVDGDAIDQYNHYLKPHFDRKDVEVDFYFKYGVGIVMVSAKWDSKRSIDEAVNVFEEIHRLFLQTIPSMVYLTRLLVPAAHAKKLIILHSIKSRPWTLTIYLIDSLSVLFPGDVIVDVEVSNPARICDGMKSVLRDLREFGVDESMMSKFKTGNYICPSYHEISAPGNGKSSSMMSKFKTGNYICPSSHKISAPGNGKSSSMMKPPKEYAILEFKRIPLSFIDYIIGEDGANLGKIWKSSQAFVYLQTHSAKEVVINIVGETYEVTKDSKDAMEELIPNDKKIYGEARAFEAMFQRELEEYPSSDGEEAGSPIL
ncbi:unnamed protein product [Cuscuta campestris]|uniref:K Homology domain-containing protein n=1 Tax=Cuscuta campestris TaxID=132261 RepID=A0A484LX45_9ASTE|nr:unnamed protein product [Cuscuta campestris]